MRVALASLVALVLAACTLAPEGARSGPSPAPTSAAAPPATSPAPTTPSEVASTPPSRRRPVTLAFAGDVHFEGVLRARLDDPATALAPVADVLASADLAMVNLETSIGAGGQPEQGKRFTFQVPPSAFRALAAAGIDVASMANNHALDLGRAPLPDTFAAMDRALAWDPPLAVVGLGRDVAGAFRPALLDVDGTVVATLGATVAGADPTADPTGHWAAGDDTPGTADALDPARLLRAVRRADREADVVVAYLHWGVQGERCPSPLQRGLAADLVRAGADVVVGSHAHVLQGDGRLRVGRREAYVAYGLGNYAWYTEDASATGVLTLTVRPPADRADAARVIRASWQPARIGPDGLPRPLPGAERPAFEADRAALRACAGLDR